MRRNGFTLVELMLVIAIISVILALTVPALTTARRKALILACKSNMHQIHIMVETYLLSNEGRIPYLFYAAEGLLDPEHLKDLETNAPGLAAVVGNNRGILKCPADTGYGGVDYGLTSSGITCFSCFGQSYVYNNSAYTDPSSPYGLSKPARYANVSSPERIIMLTDFSSAWHGVAGSGKESPKYFLNIMYFDGHVEGKEFVSDQAAKTYRNEESRRCWWADRS
jgi:prepilin-type N-terminal cleavage/methylation domain-containing protein/prepilin-type processing-associated H-X9-DG protein